jgi:multicomponent Na+:H+ antiporter subunit G
MSELIATLAIVAGTTFAVLSAVGLLRMPDVYIRLQVASKASSLGVALLMLGVAAHFDDLSVTIRALLVVAFLFITAPVAAHVIGRAAYLTRVPLAPETEFDELAGAYDAATGRLAGARTAAQGSRSDAGGQPSEDPESRTGSTLEPGPGPTGRSR